MNHLKRMSLSPTDKSFAAIPTLDVHMSTLPFDKYQPDSRMDNRDEYRMALSCSVKFVANRAELDYAKKNAYRALGRYMYSDVVRALGEIHGALFAGDIKLAHQICEALESEIDDFVVNSLRESR